MFDFPIDPEVRVRGVPERVLRRTLDALTFLKQMSLASPTGPWPEILQALENVTDEWTAMEAVVRLEIALEAEGRLIEEKQSPRLEPMPIAQSA